MFVELRVQILRSIVNFHLLQLPFGYAAIWGGLIQWGLFLKRGYDFGVEAFHDQPDA
jgi:hypothetical protein